MKNFFTLLLLLTSLISFSQETKTVKNGYITFNSGTTLHFKDLTIEGTTVKYVSDNAAAETTVSISGVKKIVDNTGAVVYGKDTAAVAKPGTASVFVPKQENEKLVYKSYTRILAGDKKLKSDEVEALLKPHTDIYDTYKKGMNQSVWGDVLIGGGIGFAIGKGIGNTINANKNNNGSPAGIIVGAVVAVVGIPIKLGGTKKVKQAVNRYNGLPANPVSFTGRCEFNVVAGAGGVGLQWRF